MTHDQVNLGVKFKVTFWERVETKITEDRHVKSLFVGQKKELIEKMKEDS